MSNLDFKPAWRLTLAALALALALALSACASGRASPPPPSQPAKPPQVVYRIDDHRYFELTPDETCFGNMLYFIDTAKGIRSEVVTFDAVMNRTTLIIDAANDQYLVAPVTRGVSTVRREEEHAVEINCPIPSTAEEPGREYGHIRLERV
ncbi:T6SS immunity protein Tli3 family protein [Variovorax boronicumulans]|uniref:T6SS immunity protein Tli3 family protein n=1 Tax=Variovorax boronicumulans TaxID=436515 RepID=UPI00277D2AB4|nr:hypothetical protein [Variovorax boronicumulans]MDQ0042587.1 hypothetical protein [Variovorax boronicumulans]